MYKEENNQRKYLLILVILLLLLSTSACIGIFSDEETVELEFDCNYHGGVVTESGCVTPTPYEQNDSIPVDTTVEEANSEGDSNSTTGTEGTDDSLEESIQQDAGISEEETAEDQVPVLTTDEVSGEPLKILFLETKDGWCFPKKERSESQICGYTIDWKVEYSSPGETAGLKCIVEGVDNYNSETERGQFFQSPTGVWEFSLDVSGFYPELGEYTEKFFCDLYDANFSDGELVSRVEIDIIAPLTTIRDPEQ